MREGGGTLCCFLQANAGAAPVPWQQYIRRFIASNYPLIPRTMIAHRLLRSNHMRPHMKDGEPLGVAIQERQRTANASARQQIARLVFLKGARPAPDQF